MSYSAEDPWLVPFLSLIRRRPGMYLGDENVRTLDCFIRGYVQARLDLGLRGFGPEEEFLLDEFGDWLRKRNNSEDQRLWPTLVEKADPSRDNVKTFLRLFDEFLSDRGTPFGDGWKTSWTTDSWKI